ncbi:glycoside hydrolase clan GH-D [Beutenbergia cavernae DSM 12333]|uniref:alpha-galactosidase n=1 Tax=Beutenbergia cavernae (strain ATCC BAA-8 / DSM 12333 / CCUG 43141 / JCM 11478 / NBRC 16432 / NCIMB 13614 / HKI 0122) TaxID=471853 RepID=C5BV21_BEUC1|nr:alpha-galactosidase [Beutenbergia cavernae]ACQ78395.1 glycoside hydrolase clan GH-D [Beutenbergia cavernae DSM 12333]
MSAQLDLVAGDQPTLAVRVGGRDAVVPSGLFRLEIDRRVVDGFDDGSAEVLPGQAGVRGSVADGAAHVEWSAREIAGRGVWELAARITNTSDRPITLTRMDPLSARLAPGRWTTLHFRSAWGDEFAPERGTTDSHLRLDVRSGRSSHGRSPWLGLENGDAGVVVAPAWSGNWHIDVIDGGRVDAGISTWRFATVLQPGESVTAPSVVLAAGSTLDDAAVALAAAVGAAWIPRSPASEAMPVEWNHWWPYEDQEVDEGVIWRNAEVAASCGFDVATVDAGWFGAPEADSVWMEQRGDWHQTNTARFPSGLAALGAGIRDRGVKAGMWIEAEAIGAAAELRRSRPDVVALSEPSFRHDPSYGVQTVSLDPDDPSFLGYVCLGSPAGREHVSAALDALVTETGAEWIKLDFNIDPDSGCRRTDHGHGADDGLFRHYEGLYAVLDAFRERHPEVVLESCSSGGLRLDLGLARHVHCHFLSDPDYTEHHLQVLWGASLMLPPAAILHWSWSQWRGDYPPARKDFAALGTDEFDAMLRAAMMHRFGVSLRLDELRPELLERLSAHVSLFHGSLADLVRSGSLRRLSEQPVRGRRGERAPAFQLVAADRHAVFAFRLDGAEDLAPVHPVDIDDSRDYRVTDVDSGDGFVRSGAELRRSGLSPAESRRSALWLLDAV